MVLKPIPGKIVIRLYINDKSQSGYYRGQASSKNVRSDIEEMKRKARLNAYYNFFKDGGNIRTKILDEQKTYREFSDFSPSMNKVENEALTEIRLVETKIFYFGTARYFRSITNRPKVANKKATIRIKRENWNGKYVSVTRRINSGKKSGSIVTWNKWKPKESSKRKFKSVKKKKTKKNLQRKRNQKIYK